jgi:hypothetical protein
MYHKSYNLFGSTYLTTALSEKIDLLHFTGFSAQFVYDNTTPAAGTFTAAVTDICTKNNHGYSTGLKVRVASADRKSTRLNSSHFVGRPPSRMPSYA